MGIPSERSLIEELAQGQEQAFATLYDLFGLRLYRVARALLGCGPDAEDAVQEVFVGLLRSRQSLARVENLRGYVFAALRAAAGRIAQARQKRRADSRDLDEMPAPEERGLNAAQDAALERALRSLPPEQRELIALKIDGELTLAEIATCLGISPNTAASRYRYALTKLRAAFEE